VHFEPRHVVVKRNPLYFGERAGNLARAEYLAILDETERLERFRRGDLDLAQGLFEMPEELASCLQHWPRLATFYLAFSPQPPLDDLRLRRAIAMAMDRQRMAERSGTSPATGGLVPPGMPGHTPGLALPYDPPQARCLLAEAGYPGGHGLPPLRLLYYRGVIGAMIAQSLREALAVEVDLHTVVPSDPPDDLNRWQLLFQGWVADVPDPDNFLRHSGVLGTLRKADWRDPELDALLERAAHTPDRAVRMAMYRQADRRLVAEQALVVPLGYGGTKELRQPWVSGERPNKMGSLNLKDVVVEKHANA
jgi:oligopeptide transport system substrate-binding protein